MGKVTSADTVTSTAYLTETGRRYLFGKDNTDNQIRFNDDGTDNFQVTKFSLYDNDKNYRTTLNFPTGTMPDLAGTSDDTCLKTCSDLKVFNFILYQGTIPENFEGNFTYQSRNFVLDAYTFSSSNNV